VPGPIHDHLAAHRSAMVGELSEWIRFRSVAGLPERTVELPPATPRVARMTPQERRLTTAAPRPAGGFISHAVLVDGLRLHVRQRVDPHASGVAWLLVHGLAVSHRYLMPTAAALPGAVYVPDLPGFGLSQRPVGVYDTGRHAAVLGALMDRLGLTTAAVLGNSFGCQVAVELAIHRPELVSALVLVGPTTDPAAASKTGQALRWLLDLTREDPRQASILLRDLRDAGLPRVLHTLQHSVRHRMQDRLSLVTAPVMVLRGERDPIAPPSWVDEARRLTRSGGGARASDPVDVPAAAHNAVTTAGPVVAARAAVFADAWRPGPATATDRD
jgi:pimeloyl-ACP methyl ester carboxylesterase